MISINILHFICNIIYFLSYHNVILHYDKIYGGNQDYVIDMYFTKFYIIRSKKYAQMVLSKKLNSQISYLNNVFFDANGHKYGIGNLDYVNDHDQWNFIHNCLVKSICLEQFNNILNKYKYILTSKYNFQYDIVKASEDFVYHVWCDFCFDKNDITFLNDYIDIKDRISKFLYNTFHHNKMYMIPFIGSIYCKIKFWVYKNDYTCIDQRIRCLINNSNNGFIHKFKNNIENSRDNVGPNCDILIDNTFLSFLVYDFINIYVQHFLAEKSVNDNNDFDNTHLQNNVLSKSFLFPYRLRKISNNYDIFKKGDYVLIDMVKSENLFSYGPRVCVGIGLVNKLTTFLHNLCNEYNITPISTKLIKNNNKDVPTIIQPYIIKLDLDKNYLKNNLKSFYHKNLKFYKIEEITENPILFKYCINNVCNHICNIGNIDCIVTSESRGFIFSSPVAEKLNLPLFCARKKGKLPGDNISVSYKKTYDSIEEIELSRTTNFSNNNVVIIDDGIASGATTIALHELIVKLGGNVSTVITIVKHTYTECKYHATNIFSIFEL